MKEMGPYAEILFIPISIVLGWVVTRYLDGIGRQWSNFNRKKISPFYTGWLVALLLWLTQFCWVSPRLAALVDLHFLWFAFLIALVSIFYMMSIIAFPLKDSKKSTERNSAYFRRNLTGIYYLMGAYQWFIIGAGPVLKNVLHTDTGPFASHCRDLFAVLLIYGVIYPKNTWLRYTILAFALITIITFIVVRSNEYSS